MASEITVTAGLQLANGNLKDTKSVSLKVNQTTAKNYVTVQDVGTSHEAIAIPGDIATPGWAEFVNLDPTNYVEIGVVVSATFYPVAKLKAGEPAMFRIAGSVTLYAKANAVACPVEVRVYAD
jgi:hypothetical protein